MNQENKDMVSQKEDTHATRLYHWYLEEIIFADGRTLRRAHGIVSGHKRLPDGFFIHTSNIMDIKVDVETGNVIIQTLNTEYHCNLSDCDFSQPDTCNIIPELSEYAQRKGLPIGKPYFNPELQYWVINDGEHFEFGSVDWVVGEFIEDNLFYKFSDGDHAHSFNAVLQKVIDNPDIPHIEGDESQYSQQELRIIRKLQEKSNFPHS